MEVVPLYSLSGEHLYHAERDIDWILGGDRVHNALVLVDGCDHYTAADAPKKGWSAAAAAMNAGRFGGQSIQPTGTYTKSLPSALADGIIGFAVKAGAASTVHLTLRASTTATMQIGTNSSSILQVLNSSGTVIATGTTVLTNGTWYYIEVKWHIAGASGTTEVHLNGVSEITSTTGNFGSSNIDNFRLNLGTSYDDFYVCDTTGSAPRNTFLGDVRVATVMPNADGAHTDWTPSAAGSHFSKVNEAQADGDTTYVSDATAGHIDTYVTDDVDSGATVLGVQTNLYARKDDVATRQIADVIRISSTDYVGSTDTLASTYSIYSQIHAQSPATSADWTAAEVNGAEFGVKTIA